MSQFPAYVADRATTALTGPEGAVPIARGLPGSRPPPSQAVVTPFSKGSVREALPEGAFSEVARASRFLPAYRDTVNPLGPASIAAASPSPGHCSVPAYRGSAGLSTRYLPSFGTLQRLQPGTPPRLRARCARGFGGPFRHPINEWLVQLSGPCSAL